MATILIAILNMLIAILIIILGVIPFYGEIRFTDIIDGKAKHTRRGILFITVVTVAAVLCFFKGGLDYYLSNNNDLKMASRDSTISNMSKDLQCQGESLRRVNNKIDEKDSINQSLVMQNINLIKTGNKIQHGEQGLFDQNKILISKVDDYQAQLLLKDKNIDYLRKSISAAKRGMYRTIAFDGIVTNGNQGSGRAGVSVSDSRESAFFPKLDNAFKSNNAKQLLELSNKAIAMSPEWMTPYYFKAIVLWNYGNRENAMQLFAMVEENTVGDLDYANHLAQFYSFIGDKAKVKQLQEDYNALH